MSDRPKFFDDLAGVAGGALSAFAGLREEMTAAVRARVEDAMRKMDLVKRDEFEAMAELARRARAQADALELRVAALEAKGDAEPVSDVPLHPAADLAPLESAPVAGFSAAAPEDSSAGMQPDIELGPHTET